jgi:hypothetical protein
VSEAIRRESSRLALLTRYKGSRHPDVIEARRRLATLKIEQYIARTLESAPPLSQDQQARIIRTLGSKLDGKPDSPALKGGGVNPAFPSSFTSAVGDREVVANEVVH